MAFDVRTLHEIERKIIKALANGKLALDALTQQTGLNVDQVRRGIEWLRYKNLINVNEKVHRFVEIDDEGRNAIELGLPEKRLLDPLKKLGGRATIAALRKALSELTDAEFNIGLSKAMLNHWIERDQYSNVSEASVVISSRIEESEEGKFLRKIASSKVDYDSLTQDDIKAYQSLKRRPHYLTDSEEKTVEVELSQQGLAIVKDVETVLERAIDVSAPAPIIYAGRKHPLQDVVDEVREVFIGLGFEEIEGPIVQNSFWNFDALFTPQDHPAREMQDTFYITNMKAGNVADKKIVNSVTKIHQKGWNYKWNINEARKLVLRTHTTPVTIRYLADNKPEEARVFSVGRVFRNEKLTYKHLAEFYQVEGIVVGKNVTLRDLMGLQTEFYAKMGLNKVKFWPSFFPYTEPSLQSMVYHEKLEKWVELFGMGIFRPEVTLPVGVKNPVLAWGGGLERIAMLRYGLDDVRELYNNRLSWLRSVPKCQ